MKARDLARIRKEFDATYEVNYPPKPPTVATEQGQSVALLVVWGIVSIAGAIISLPHTLNAVGGSVAESFKDMPAVAIGYSIAVFVGVELALLMVAFTQAYRQLENPRPRPVITIATMIASVAYRLGLRHRPTPPTSDNDGGIGGLMIMLLASALLFNLADTTQNKAMMDVTKIVSGTLAPVLLFLAGHEFAHNLAGKLLAGKIVARANEQALADWRNARDEAWRDYVSELESTPPPTPVEVAQKDPLAVSDTQMSLLPTSEVVTGANVFMTAIPTAHGNGTDAKKTYLMRKDE